MKRFDLVTVPLDGWNLLEANAGTGKTYSMCGLFLRMMLEGGLSHDRIVTITFTRAATGELRTRLLQTLLAARDHLGGSASAAAGGESAEDPISRICLPFRGDVDALERIERALRSFDLAPVLTIHSLCQRVLTESSLTSGFNVDATIVEQQSEVLGDIVQQAWADHLGTLSAPLVDYLKRLDRPRLTAAIERLLARPFADIDAPQVRDPGDLADELERFRSEAAEIWLASEQEVRSLLADRASDLKKNTHAPHLVERSLGVLPAYLRYGAGAAPENDVARLSQEKIARGTLKAAESTPEHPLFGALERCVALESRLREACDLYRKNLPRLLLEDVRGRLSEWKKANHALTFDDLVQQLDQALADDEVAAELVAQAGKRYGALLVDEYQDTDPLQAAIFQRLFGPMQVPVWRVGDPKQSLYGFRGADLHAYLATRETTPNCYRLVQDWRAQPALIGVINRLFSSTPRPFVLPEIQFAEAVPAPRDPLLLEIDGQEQAPLTVWPGGDKSSSAASCAGEIARLLTLAEEGRATLRQGAVLRPLEAQDLAVLVRSNTQARDMAESLAALGIASSRAGAESVFETPEAAEFERLLHAVLQPARRDRQAGALATRLFGFTASQIKAFRDDETAQDRWADRFRAWRETWSGQGVYALLLTVLRDANVANRVLPMADGPAVMSNLLQLADLMESFTGGGGHTLDDQVRWLNGERQSSSRADDRIVRLDRDSQVVRIATVHRAKGAEYPVVFCPFLWRSRTPPRSYIEAHEGDQLVLDFGTEHAERRAEAERQERVSENSRIAYVALTRAQAACYLPWSSDSHSRTAESGLSHLLIPEHAENLGLPPTKKKQDYDALVERYLDGFRRVGASVLAEAPAFHQPLSRRPRYARHREPGVRPARRWQVTSYSRLFSGGAQDRDVDEQIGADPPPATPADYSIAALPAGAHTGLMMHDLLENLPGFDVPAAAIGDLALRYLQRYSLPQQFAAALAGSVTTLLTTPLGPEKILLSQVPGHEQLREMEFHLHSAGLEPSLLWQAVRGTEPPAYFNSQVVRGYVHGFVDLIVCWQGRYWVVDYKSTRLGSTTGDYGAAQLASDVMLHDYDFQYHLYLLALDRHLASCLPGYRYERDVGGVLYLYLRGVDSLGHGVHYHRPDHETVARLRRSLLK